jgi:hypothetical protein
VGVIVAFAGIVKVSVAACVVVLMLAGLLPASLVVHFCCEYVDGSFAVTRPLKNKRQMARYDLVMLRLDMLGDYAQLAGSDSWEGWSLEEI